MRRFHYTNAKILLYVTKELRSEEVRKRTPIERWIWIALRMLLADCPYRPVLCLAPGVPFTDEQIALQLEVSVSAWKTAKKKLIEQGKIKLDKKCLVVKGWKEDRERDRRGVGRDDWDGTVPTEEEIREDAEKRDHICRIYEELTGVYPDPNSTVVVREYQARKREGATMENFITAVRTYVTVTSPGTLLQARAMHISNALSQFTFWRFVRINRPAFGRQESTWEYYKALETRELKKLAYAIVGEYTKKIKEYMRRYAIRSMSEIDWTKVTTCKQNLINKIGDWQKRQ